MKIPFTDDFNIRGGKGGGARQRVNAGHIHPLSSADGLMDYDEKIH